MLKYFEHYYLRRTSNKEVLSKDEDPRLLNWVHLSSRPEKLQNPENTISINVELYNRRTYHATSPDNFVIGSQFLTILLFTLSHQEINAHVQRDTDIQTAYAYNSAKAYSQRPSACSDLHYKANGLLQLLLGAELRRVTTRALPAVSRTRGQPCVALSANLLVAVVF